ncbi:MAG: site-specific integrase [Gammaproteobacteria bacterium]|nr:site-specific integrase [Gammaproteobacteria bacterium]MCP5135349.1 site-specific integrase [Gammaproteobacteria bacterium]
MTTSLSLEELYSRYALETDLKPATTKHYHSLIRLALREFVDLGADPNDIETITRDHVLRWRLVIQARASPRTWNNYSDHFRVLWKFGVDHDLVDTNPWQKTRLKIDKKRKKTLSLELLGRALFATQSGHLEPGWFWSSVIRTLYYTGIRRRQLIGLRGADYDADNHLLTLRSDHSKTRQERIIPLVRGAHAAIEDLLRGYRAEGVELGPNDQLFNVTRVYTRYSGASMSEYQVSGFFRRLSDELGESISAHRLRHTFGTELAERVDIKTVQVLMGHADIRSTLGYVHPNLERQRSALDQLPTL